MLVPTLKKRLVLLGSEYVCLPSLVSSMRWQALPPDIWEDIALCLIPALEPDAAGWDEPLRFVPCAAFGHLSACCRDVHAAQHSQMQHFKEVWLSIRPGPRERMMACLACLSGPVTASIRGSDGSPHSLAASSVSLARPASDYSTVDGTLWLSS